MSNEMYILVGIRTRTHARTPARPPAARMHARTHARTHAHKHAHTHAHLYYVEFLNGNADAHKYAFNQIRSGYWRKFAYESAILFLCDVLWEQLEYCRAWKNCNSFINAITIETAKGKDNNDS